jgi:hypothetical protein
MAFNVNNFISAMTKDGARPNLFEIVFADAGQNFTIRARASSLPASSIGQAGAYYFGRLAKFAGNRVFGDWAVTVLVDEPDFLTGPRAALEKWSNSLNAHVSNNRNGGYLAPSSYMKDATVIQYGKSGDVIATYLMRGCFPRDISAMPLDWGSNDSIAEFSVTFSMQYWERSGITS